MTAPQSAIVIGAGIVGVACALYLKREGLAVTLIDPREPGDGASFGNSGNLGIASCVPHALPGIIAKVPKMMFDRQSPLKLRWEYLPQVAPWLARFVASARPSKVESIADARDSLLRRLYEGYDPLLEMADARALIVPSGLLFTYESEAAWTGARYALDLRRKRGVEMREISGEEAREIEPTLSPAITRAVFFPRVSRVTDPKRLTQRLAECFVRHNGMLLREAATGFESGAGAVLTDTGRHTADLYVIAAGVWSRKLAESLGVKLPLAAERGYHAMIPEPGAAMQVPIISADRYVALTPMEGGLRVSGLAEFADIDAPPDWHLTDRLVRHAQSLLPGLKAAVGSRWVGSRPSFPDSKPVIGRAPGHANVILAFGHDHIGLALGGITGRIVADLAMGRDPGVDLTPFRPDRF